MPPLRFAVTTALSLTASGPRSATRVLLRDMRRELGRLRRSDPRLVHATMRATTRCGGYVEVVMVLVAPDAATATEVAVAAVRACAHAAGGATAGWREQCAAAVAVTPAGPTRAAWPRPAPVTSWAQAAAEQMRRAASVPPLPPVARPPVAGRVVDLRAL